MHGDLGSYAIEGQEEPAVYDEARITACRPLFLV